MSTGRRDGVERSLVREALTRALSVNPVEDLPYAVRVKVFASFLRGQTPPRGAGRQFAVWKLTRHDDTRTNGKT